MPRYTMITPQFTPVDYATRIRPLEQYKEEYDKRADALDEQGVLADAIGGLIDENKDPELAKTYNDFNTTLVDDVTNLMQTGDLGASRQALSQLKRRFAKDILPIKDAADARIKDAEAYKKRVEEDDTYIGVDPKNRSLLDYYKGKRPINEGVSGANLYKTAKEGTAASSARNVLLGEWGLDDNLLGIYFSKTDQTGWTEDEVQRALSAYVEDQGADSSKITREEVGRVKDALNSINDAVDGTLKMYGVDSKFKNEPEQLSQARQAALQGAINGITYKGDEKTLSATSLNAKKGSGDGSNNSTNLNVSETNKHLYAGRHSEAGRAIRNTTFKDDKGNTVPSVTIGEGDEAETAANSIEAREIMLRHKKAADDARTAINTLYGKYRESSNLLDDKAIERLFTPEEREILEVAETLAREETIVANKWQPYAMTDKDMRLVAKALGVEGEVSYSDALAAMQNNIDFYDNTEYNEHVVADNSDAASKDILEKMSAKLADNLSAGRRRDRRANEIYDANGNLMERGLSDLIKQLTATTTNKTTGESSHVNKIQSIKLTPQSARLGCYEVKVGNKKYFIKANYFGNEIGGNTFDAGIPFDEAFLTTHIANTPAVREHLSTDGNGNYSLPLQYYVEGLMSGARRNSSIATRLQLIDNILNSRAGYAATAAGHNRRTVSGKTQKIKSEE